MKKLLIIPVLLSSLEAATITWGAPVQITGDTNQLIDDTIVTVVDYTTINQNFYQGTAATGTPTSYGFTGAVYEQFLDDIKFDNSSNPYTETMTGLLVGNTYQVQVFYVDQRNAAYAGRTMTVDGTAVLTAASGDFTIGTFVADAATQDFEIVAANGTAGLHLNGFIYATVPEPTSAALLGLGGLALVVRRRR